MAPVAPAVPVAPGPPRQMTLYGRPANKRRVEASVVIFALLLLLFFLLLFLPGRSGRAGQLLGIQPTPVRAQWRGDDCRRLLPAPLCTREPAEVGTARSRDRRSTAGGGVHIGICCKKRVHIGKPGSAYTREQQCL